MQACSFAAIIDFKCSNGTGAKRYNVRLEGAKGGCFQLGHAVAGAMGARSKLGSLSGALEGARGALATAHDLADGIKVSCARLTLVLHACASRREGSGAGGWKGE